MAMFDWNGNGDKNDALDTFMDMKVSGALDDDDDGDDEAEDTDAW